MKKLIVLTILLSATIWFNLKADCTFRSGQSVTVYWNANPDSQNVSQYWVYFYDSTHTDWTLTTPDTFLVFDSLERTTSFYVKADNGKLSKLGSDTVTAWYETTIPTDIPYSRTASEIWASKGIEWFGFTGCWYHKDVFIGEITDITFWTHRPETGDLDSTFIYANLNFEGGEYDFTLTLSRWTEYVKVYVGIDQTDYLIPMDKLGKKSYTITIPVLSGNRKVTVKVKTYPAYLYNLSIEKSGLMAPGRVTGTNVKTN